MTSSDLIEKVARAIAPACPEKFQIEARAAIAVVLEAIYAEASSDVCRMTYDDALEFVLDFAKEHAIPLNPKER